MPEKVQKEISDSIMYDAFISYRHIEPDASIAEKIHQKLERYHIPKKIQERSGKKKISRIFRDKEELPLSANLTENIYEALDHSEFLVLICSPESMASLWVQRELEYFLEKHDKEHVITVLASGEPEESFPDILCRETKTINDINGETLTVTVPVEPLAADVRGKNKSESLKKLNVEILRLLACMLGCHYDSLKQRHREYLIKRTTCIASTIIIAMSIFGGYAYFQLQQIQMEHEASLKYQKESIQNQAKNLAQQSVDVLAEGKREEALKKALAADLEMLTNENTEEAIIPEQMYALNSALYSYRDGHRILFAPECTMDIQGIANGCFSKDGTWYYAWNESNEGYVFSGENGQLLCKINTSEIESITEGDSKIVRLIPYEENKAIVVMVHAVAVLDVCSHEFREIFPVETDLTNISSYDLEGNHLILNTEQVMCLCDVEKGKVLHSVNVYDILGYQNNGDYMYPTIKDVDIATNGTKAVYAVTCNENPNTEIPGLFTYDFATKECQIFSMIQTTDVNYIDDSHIIVIHKEVPEAKKGTIDARAYYKYYSAVYDIISGEILYTSEKTQILDSYYSGIEIMNLTEGDEKYLAGIYWIDNNISIINLNTYEFYGMVAMDDSILNVIQFGENSFLTGSVDGWIQRIVLSDMILRFDCMNISAALSGIAYNIVNGKLVVLTDETAIFCGNSIDKEMRTITYENLLGSVENIEYYEAGKEIYRCVNLLSSDYIYEGSIFYKSGSDKPVISFKADNQGDYSAIIDVFEKNEQDFAYIVEADAYGIATEIHTINLTEGKETGILDLSSYGIETFYDFSFNKTHEMFFAETQNGLEAFLITDTAIKKQENFHLEDKYSIMAWKMTGDGEWIFLCEQENGLSTDGAQNHVILNTLTGQFKQIKMDIEAEGAVLIPGNNSSRLCIQDGQFLHLIDCAEGKELSHITLTTDANVKMSFFRNDELLLVTYKNYIEIYEVKSGYLLGSYTFESTDVLQKEFRSTMDPITDSDGDYFALKEHAYMADTKRSSNTNSLIIFYMDEDAEIHKYAEVPYGYASLAGQEIVTKTQTSFSFTAFHDYSFLKKKAEEILSRE